MRIEVALAMKTVKNHNILAYRCTIKSVQRGNVIVRVFEISVIISTLKQVKDFFWTTKTRKTSRAEL